MIKEYTATKVEGAIDWQDIDCATMDYRYFDTDESYSAFAQVAYDDENLYVHLVKTEEETLTTQSGILGLPCLDSCLEFFFCPMENDTRYFNIEFNSQGCVFFGFGSNADTLFRLVPEGADTADWFSPEIEKTEEGWELTLTIPYSLIRRIFPDFEMKDGKTMRANFYTCADNTNPPHYLSWNEIAGEPFRYHRPECFGIIKF